MVKIKAGERKKQLIIDTCKRLFYQKGYNNTTYEMICESADIAPGSITYHFSSKKDIAILIANENTAKLREYAASFVREEDVGHWTFTSVVIWFRWFFFLVDPSLRRFFSELYIDATYLHSVIELFAIHQQHGMKTQEETGLYLLASTIIGQDYLILNMLEDSPEHFSLSQIVHHCEATLFKLTDLDPVLAEKAANEGEEIFRQLTDRIDVSLFREFHD